MKYFDVVANRRACLWHDEKAISPKPRKIQTANGKAICWGMTNVIECKVSLSSFFPADIAFIRCRS